MSKNILLIHGANLNLLGTREPQKYGSTTSEELLTQLKTEFKNTNISYFQSNVEGEIVNAIHQTVKEIDGILINAGAFSHTSIAIADALTSIHKPCISVHITNIYLRENYRHTDIIGAACNGAIVGLGTEGYFLAMECLLDIIYAPF